MGPGVLEIKCPFNRGQPESASVPILPPWYYMPQVCHSWSSVESDTGLLRCGMQADITYANIYLHQYQPACCAIQHVSVATEADHQLYSSVRKLPPPSVAMRNFFAYGDIDLN